MREGDTLGRYTLERLLARGGMAQVFRARYAGAGGFSKRCVVKCILPEQARDPGLVSMFLDEARIAAELAHPGVVQVFDFGVEDGVHFLAMELIRGVDLRAVLGQARRSRDPIPIDVVLWVAHEACGGLQYVHGLGGEGGRPLNLVHRDVSLSNLMITDQGMVKLLDFGVAKTDANESRTQAGVIKGKFDYLSPEQARSEPLDGRSDLFALGIVMHELLVGERLFHRDTPMASHAAVLEAPIEKPSALRRDLTAQVDAVVMKALARDREARFASAEEMREAIGALLSESPSAGRDRLAAFVKARFADVLAETDAPSPRDIKASATETVQEAVADPEAQTEAGGPAQDAPATAEAEAAGGGRRLGGWIAGGVLVAAIAAGGWLLWSGQRDAPPWWSFEGWQATQEDVLAGAEPIEAVGEAAGEATETGEAGAATGSTGGDSSPSPRATRAGARPAKAPASPPAGSAAPAAADGATLRGELLVLCEKPCAIYVDGQRMRPDDPSAPLALPAGQRDLRVVEADSGREHAARVLIAPNRVHVEEVKFAPTFMERDGMEEW
jgi:eukaryotic-like serine/threonine-protein kinase